MGRYISNIDVERLNKEEYYTPKSSLKNCTNGNVSDCINEVDGSIKSKFVVDLTHNILKKLNVAHTSVYLYDEDIDTLTLYSSLGVAESVSEKIKFININEGMAGCTFRSGKPIDIQCIHENNIILGKELFIENNINYVGSFPIFYDGVIIGVLLLGYSKESDIDKDINFKIDNICSEISILLKNTILYKQLKKELSIRELKEKELQLFFNTAKDLLCIMDEDSYLKTVSSEWMKVLGWSEEELLNRKLDDFIYHEDKERVLKRILGNRRKKVNVISGYKYRLMCKDGSYRWISWNSRTLSEKGLIICTGRDITDEILMEEKNRELEKIVQLEVVRNEFFANMSHEFKTPLNIILTTMQLINQNIDSKKIYSDKDVDLFKYMNSIKQNTYRLLRLTNNLIDITKIDTGYYELDLDSYNIVNIIEDITLSVVEYVNSKDMELIFDTEIEELEMACDPEKIERIMLNLLSNAVKYSEVGGKIIVHLKKIDNNLQISVKDTGIGIPKEKQGIIFNRFSQIDQVLTKRAEGSGIGLSLVKALVEMHHGVIELESEVGGGSEFKIKLPIREFKSLGAKRTIYSNFDSKVEKCNIEFSDIYR